MHGWICGGIHSCRFSPHRKPPGNENTSEFPASRPQIGCPEPLLMQPRLSPLPLPVVRPIRILPSETHRSLPPALPLSPWTIAAAAYNPQHLWTERLTVGPPSLLPCLPPCPCLRWTSVKYAKSYEITVRQPEGWRCCWGEPSRFCGPWGWAGAGEGRAGKTRRLQLEDSIVKTKPRIAMVDWRGTPKGREGKGRGGVGTVRGRQACMHPARPGRVQVASDAVTGQGMGVTHLLLAVLLSRWAASHLRSPRAGRGPAELRRARCCHWWPCCAV